jgi:hypothetical protein
MHADAETIKKNISNRLPRMVYNIYIRSSMWMTKKKHEKMHKKLEFSYSIVPLFG